MLGPRNQDLLTVDDIAVAVTKRNGLQLCRVGAGGRLGDRKRLEPEVTGCDLWQVRLPLLRRTVPKERAHDVHLGVARGGIPDGTVDLFENDRRFAEFQTGAPILFGNQGRQVAALRQRLYRRFGIGARGVELMTVGVWESTTEVGDRRSQILM